jgi:hypothetical protein
MERARPSSSEANDALALIWVSIIRSAQVLFDFTAKVMSIRKLRYVEVLEGLRLIRESRAC